MKKSWVTRITKLCKCAALLVCLSFSGCLIPTEENTCNSTATEHKWWYPEQDGFMEDLPFKVDGAWAYWSADLGGADNNYVIQNVCPDNAVRLNVRAAELFLTPERQAVDYVVYVSFEAGGVFKVYKRYHLVRNGPYTIEKEIKFTPAKMSDEIEAGLEIFIRIMVTVPISGNETEENALQWAKENIANISIDANFTRYH